MTLRASRSQNCNRTPTQPRGKNYIYVNLGSMKDYKEAIKETQSHEKI